jgi:RNA polymerase sigma factor (sigma-70 family)
MENAGSPQMRPPPTHHDAPPTPASAEAREGAETVVDADRALLTLLFNKHRSALLNHVRRMVRSREDAAELVQETYLRVMGRTPVGEFEKIARAYLFQTATNLARDHFRRQRFRTHSALDDVPEAQAPVSGSPEDELHWSQTMDALRGAIDAMPPGTRAVFLLARIEHKPYAEIAQALGLSVRTVERRMSEAIDLLAVRLEDLL